MPIASVAKSRVAYIAEQIYGSIPATPVWQEIGRTTGGLRTKKTTNVSDEIHADRNVRDEFEVGQDVEGSYGFELKPGAFDDLFAGAFRGAWVNDALINGVLEPSFSFEETIFEAGTPYYSRFAGVMISTLSLAIASRQVIKGTIGLMGQKEVLDAVALTGATYTPSPTTDSIKAHQIGALTIAGLTTPPVVKTLNFNLSNNLRIRDAVGTLYSQQFGDGQADITGTMDAYFADNSLYQQVLNHGGGALSCFIGTGNAGHGYVLAMPNLVFLDGSKVLGGKNDDVMVSIPFRARFDAGIGASARLTRNVSGSGTANFSDPTNSGLIAGV